MQKHRVVTGCDTAIDRQEIHRRAADKVADEHRRRKVIDLVRRAGLQHFTLIHHDDIVGHRHGFALVVRHVHRRRGERVMQLAQLETHQLAKIRIERAERFVHQKRLRLPHDRAAKRHALPVAAGKTARLAVENVFDAQHVRGRIDPRGDFLARYVLVLQRKRDVVAHRHVRIKREHLEHEGDIAFACAQRRHVFTVDQNLSGSRQFESGDHPQRGGLAAAGRSEQNDKAPGADRQTGIAHRDEIVEALVKVGENDGGHGVSPENGS